MAVPGGSRAAFMLRALRYRNYRLFFGGQVVSLIGTWITTTATSWLVYRLTGSAFLLGFVGFAGQLPAFLAGPFAGTYIDRWNRHRVLVVTQTISMFQSFALALLMFTGQITIPAIVVLSAVQGLVNAFDMPCRQAFLSTMIEDREDLGNAIALNSSMFNTARLLGPSIAGAIIAVAGEGWCFLLDGFSYFAVIIALLQMRIPARSPGARRDTSALQEFVQGWRYVFGFGPMRSIIGLLALVSVVGIPYLVLMPIFADTILGGGPYTLGFLMTASGAGALLGALWLAARRSVIGLGRVIPIAAAIFGLGLIAFALSRSFWLSMFFMVITGFGLMVQMASSNTLIQTIVDDEMRGRVMSFYVMAFLGTAPFGSLMAGSLSARIGAPYTLMIGGVICLAGAARFATALPAIRQAVRPIYVRMGILPELADRARAATDLMIPPEV
jgi:MFS family permease